MKTTDNVPIEILKNRKKTDLKLVIHRGTHEIGGSCVELSTATTRIVIDVGLPLVNADREPFDQKLIQGKTIEELLADDTAPNVAGLFNEGPSPDAILLSHSHLDHAGLLHLTKPEIPIFASKGTSQMMLAGAVFSRQQSLERERHREVKPSEKVTIGDFSITSFSVDHSSYGALAYLVEADDQTLLYSGDLRMHGRKPGMARDLIANVGKRNVEVLLMEGTHFGSSRTLGQNEFQLEEELIEHIKTAPALVLAAFSPVDVDRQVSYYKSVRRAGRTFVVDAYAAFVLYLISKDAGVPEPTREFGIRVLFNRAFRNRNHKSMEERFADDQITLDEILAEPHKHAMVFRPSMTELDFEGQLPEQSRCLYSYWKGYLTNPDWVELQQQIEVVNGDFIPAHTSGHIYIQDIIDFVNAVGPRTVIPIHTFEPEAYKQHFPNVKVLDDGRPYEIV